MDHDPPADPESSSEGRPTGPDAIDDATTGAYHRRVLELESELRVLAAEASATRSRMQRELDRSASLLLERERALAQAKADLIRLRNRRVVRWASNARRATRAPVAVVRRASVRVSEAIRPVAASFGLARPIRRMATAQDQAALAASIVASLPPAPHAAGRVSVIIEAGRDPANLEECLAGLEGTDWDDLEILVSGIYADRVVRVATQGDQRAQGARRVRPVNAGTPEDSRREALALSTGEHILFLHDDVRPLEPTWLRRMVATIRDEGAGAVGARLILPAGAGDRSSGPADLTLAHLGIEFVPEDGVPEPQAIGLGGEASGPGLGGRTERPAASEACLLTAKETLDELGLPGPSSDDSEPVELCLRIRRSGRRIVVDGDAVLWHSRALLERPSKTPQTADHVGSLADRWGPMLHRSVLRDRIYRRGRWSSRPLRVGITLSKDDVGAGHDDWYTAHDLGSALARLGWQISYLERFGDRWYGGAARCDVVVSLLDGFDLFKIPRHVIAAAWIQNHTEGWTTQPWFDNYDLVLVTSGRSKEIVERSSAKVAHLFPIATNPERFHPVPANEARQADAVFVGSHQDTERQVGEALPALASSGRVVRVYGRGWEEQTETDRLSHGLATNDTLPEAYASAALAIDDAAPSARPYGSVDSSVFDALATGTLVVSNNELGVRELFDEDFPTWDGPASLVRIVEELLADPARRHELAARYRQQVLDLHTYDRRAIELRDILDRWVAAPKVAAHIGPQTWEMGWNWGDIPFGRDVQRNLERRGYPTAVLVHAERASAAAVRTDIALHLFGVRAPKPIHSQLNALWVISHPDRATAALCNEYDVVFVASDVLLGQLAERVAVPLFLLRQATEPSRFYPDPTGPHHQLLFIGNSRGVTRPIVEDLRGTPWDLAVYGSGWTSEMLDPGQLQGEWVPNDEVRRFYSSADIVLSDHWGDMREMGIISNRVYDALASGAFVVSDRVSGIEAEFDDAVATYETREELLDLIERSLADPVARRETAQRGRAAVLSRHTFAHRIDRVLEVLEPLLAARDLEVDPRPGAGDTPSIPPAS